MPTAAFDGDKKVGKSILSGPENRLKDWAVPKIPAGIETYHLTLMTVVWSLVNVLAGLLAARHLGWLWLVSAMIVMQYLTDLFDGEVGRRRKTGLIKWGFYMDHFLDFIFLGSLVFVGFMIAPSGLEVWYFALVIILGGFMVSSFLNFAATNRFEIYHCGIGPTETRVVFLSINTYVIVFGTVHFDVLLPLTVLVCVAGLTWQCYRAHKRLWQIDMADKILGADK